MIDKVFVIKSLDEAQAVLTYLEQTRLDQSSFTIIGLEPKVRAFLKRRGVECGDTLPFFDNVSHARVLQKSEELAQLMKRDLQLDIVDGLQEICLRDLVSRAYWRWNLMLKRIEVLESIRHAHAGSTLFLCSRPAASQHNHPLYSLSARFCQQHGVPLETIPLRSNSDRSSHARADKERDRLGYTLDRLITWCYLGALGMQSRSKFVLTVMPFTGSKNPLLRSINARFPQLGILSLRHKRLRRWEELGRALYWLLRVALRFKPTARPLSLPLHVFKEPLGRGAETLVRETTERAMADFLERNATHFTYRDVSFLDEFRTVVDSVLVPGLVTTYKLAQVQAHILRRFRPALVLSAFSMVSLGPVCALNGIPAMLIPLKTLVKPKSALEAIGEAQIGRAFVTNDYPFAAVQSPLALGYMRYTNYTGRLVRTGPLIWSKVEATSRQRRRDQFFEKMGGPGQIVVYAPSTKRIHTFYVLQTPDEVLSSMADVVQTTAGLKGVYLVLRLHPDAVIKRSDVETLIDLAHNVTISDGDRASFADILALADVLISNTSTTAEEAIQNGIPVILYDKWERYNHLDAPPVRTGIPDGLSPAYYVSAKAHLDPTLRWVLEAHASNPTIPSGLLARYVFEEDLSQNFYDFVRHVVEDR